MTKLLTVKEVAEMLRLHENTIYLKVEKGEIPHINIGGVIRFDKESLQEWFKNQMVKRAVNQ